MLECKYCGQNITFDDDHVSPRGKKIPLDAETMNLHNCPEAPAREITCNRCGGLIYFDDEHISKNGKKIPMSVLTHNPHQCEDME